MGDGVTLINMGEATALAIKEMLTSSDSLNDGKCDVNHKFYASDKTAAFKRTVAILLGNYNKDFHIEQVDIEKIWKRF